MNSLVVVAFVDLLYVHRMLRRRRFQHLIGTLSVRSANHSGTGVQAVCDAVNRAGCWLHYGAHCLERSLTAVRLLRRRGVPAQLVMGITDLPIRGHTWVEVDGAVVNDNEERIRTHYKQIVARF